jgi:hypothetical protein
MLRLPDRPFFHHAGRAFTARQDELPIHEPNVLKKGGENGVSFTVNDDLGARSCFVILGHVFCVTRNVLKTSEARGAAFVLADLLLRP